MPNVMQLCNCASVYGGNFIDSLRAFKEYSNYRNVYVFCHEADNAQSKKWINDLRVQGEDAYFLTGNYLKDFCLLKKICKKHKIYLIHSHFYHFKMFLLLQLLRTAVPVPLIHHFHNLNSYGTLKRIVNNLLLTQITYIGCSETVAQNLRINFPKNKVYALPNAISLPRLSVGGFPPERITNGCLMFGNTFYNKGVELAIKAIKHLRGQYPDLELSIVFSIEIEKNKQYIREILQMDDIPSWIHVLTPTTDIARYYWKYAYFLSPSKKEGFCTSIAEAAYCGCQVIASNIPAQYNNHKDIPSIKFFQSEDVSSFEAALRETIQSPLSVQQQEVVRAHIRRTYSIKSWVETLVSIYDKRGNP